MCKKSKLPPEITAKNANSVVTRVIYILNRWINMLSSYGKLDPRTLSADVNQIWRLLKTKDVEPSVRYAVAACRDYAISEEYDNHHLNKLLLKAIKRLCRSQEDKMVAKIKKSKADIGMTERYRPLSKRLKSEKIRRIGKNIDCIDQRVDPSSATKLVRRIVEKRAAQAIHNSQRTRDRDTNSFRHRVDRVTSFSLYNVAFTDFRPRLSGSHWRIWYSGGNKKLKAKMPYATYEEALEACEAFRTNFPDDLCPVTPYKCDYCGRWHIGHDHLLRAQMEEDIAPEATAVYP